MLGRKGMMTSSQINLALISLGSIGFWVGHGSAWAGGVELIELSLQQRGDRLALELDWQGTERSPLVNYRSSNEEFILEFNQTQIAPTAALALLPSFPDLGIESVSVQQTQDQVQLRIIPSDPLNLNHQQLHLQQQETPVPWQQRFEIWVSQPLPDPPPPVANGAPPPIDPSQPLNAPGSLTSSSTGSSDPNADPPPGIGGDNQPLGDPTPADPTLIGQASPERPLILTPSLEQNQLPDPSEDLSPEPRFEAPALEDLPDPTQTIPTLTESLLQPEPFLGELDPETILPPLQRDTLAPFPELRDPPEPVVTQPNELEDPGRSPVQRPMTRLFGFETGTTLQQGELALTLGGQSFGSPRPFANTEFGEFNRSNDFKVGFDLGITDRLQVSVGAEGKDDTLFRDLAAPGTGVSFIYQGIPAQVKWQFLESSRLDAAVVLGAQFPANTVPGRIDNQSLSENSDTRKILVTTDPELDTALMAEDRTIYTSVGLPISYQVSPRARLHVNPQVSFFPEEIPVTRIVGDVVAILNTPIGFEGQQLDYFGTVSGVGVGFDYTFSPALQFAADFTAILEGNNSASLNDETLLDRVPAWNVGLRMAPNSRLGVNLFFTNRFSPTTASPGNLLVQPRGDTALGLDVTYLPDLKGSYTLERRFSYPPADAFLSRLHNLPSSILPINSVIYQGSYGGTKNPMSGMMRVGLLDDLELLYRQSSYTADPDPESGTDSTLAIERDLVGRLALIPDRGRSGVAAAVSLGLLSYRTNDGATHAAIYTDLPFSFRNVQQNLELQLTPKVIAPTQSQGIRNLTGLSFGGTWKMSDRIQLFGEYTPVLVGSNQLVNQPVPGRLLSLFGRTPVYGAGVRGLFPSGNSLYALDLYVSNAAGDYGFQSLVGLPNGESQIGLKFSLLNGVPGLRQPDPSDDQATQPGPPLQNAADVVSSPGSTHVSDVLPLDPRLP